MNGILILYAIAFPRRMLLIDKVKIGINRLGLTNMTVTELLPTLKNLSRADKLRIMQFLVIELAKEEDALLQPGATYTVWSPYNSHEAAHKLAELLEEDKQT